MSTDYQIKQVNMCGGSWFSITRCLRSSTMYYNSINYDNFHIGFRIKLRRVK